MTLTVLMVLKVMHFEISTLLHSPMRVHILSMVVMLLGQGRVWVVPAGVSGQKRTLVCSESQKTAGESVRMEKELIVHKLGCLSMFSAKSYFVLSLIFSSQYLIFNHLCTIFPTLDAFT